jgi:Fe(3+) dicitrate transport protein
VGLSKQTASGLHLRADLRFVGEVFTDFENIERTFNRGDTGLVPRYSLLNVSARYKISSDWSVFMAGKNVLDKIYIGSRMHSNPGQPAADLSSGILIGPRRQVNVGVKRSI